MITEGKRMKGNGREYKGHALGISRQCCYGTQCSSQRQLQRAVPSQRSKHSCGFNIILRNDIM